MKFLGKAFQRQLAVILSGLIMVSAFNSCKDDRADMSGLLSTVPSSVSGVIALDLKSILQDMGCKVKDEEIKPGKELTDFLSKLNTDERAQILKLFNGETGIAPESAIIFFDSNRCFLTFSLADVEAFIKFTEKDSDTSFSEEVNGVKICRNTAVRGAQAWICLSSGKRIDADAIVGYSKLRNSQSFLSHELSPKFIDSGSDIIGWGNIRTLMSGTMSRGNMSMLTIGLNMLFDDAADLFFRVDFEKGRLEAKASILDEDYKVAKYLLPAEKINTSAIEQLGESCDALLAFTLTPKMVSKISKVGSGFGGRLFDEVTEILKNVDGTVAVISSDPATGDYRAINGFVTTKGNATNNLKDLISNMLAPTREEGKMLYFSEGNVSGQLKVKESLELIKGSCLGAVMDLKGLQLVDGSISNYASGLKSLAVSLSPESGGLEFKFILTGDDEKENILLTMMK